MAGYGDDPGFEAWLEANGYELPVGAPDEAVLRQRGSSYIDAQYGSRFVGAPTGGYAQERAWPRTGACVRGSEIPDDVIPVAVINASYEAALQVANDPASLSVVGSAAQRVRREKVEGAVEVEYQSSSSSCDTAADLTPVMTIVDGMLAPFLRDNAPSGFGVWVV